MYEISEKEIINELFFAAQFSYNPLIWIIHSRFNNNRGKYLPETCLWLIYSDKTSLYEELLNKFESISIHQGLFQVCCE